MNFLSKSISFLAEVWSRNNKQHSTKEHPLCGFSNTSEVVQSCPTLCDPMDCSLPASSIHGIFQARVLEWVAISFSRGLPDPGLKPRSPTLQAAALPSEPLGKLQSQIPVLIKRNQSSLEERMIPVQG